MKKYRIFPLLLAGILFLWSTAAFAGSGHLYVISYTAAEIFLDDHSMGVTDVMQGGLLLENVTEGEHALKAVKQGFHPQTYRVKLAPRQVLNLELRPFVPTDYPQQETTPIDIMDTPEDETVSPPGGAILIQSVPLRAVISIEALNVSAQEKTSDKWRQSHVAPGEYHVSAHDNTKAIEFDFAVEDTKTTHLFLNFLEGKAEVLSMETPVTDTQSMETKSSAAKPQEQPRDLKLPGIPMIHPSSSGTDDSAKPTLYNTTADDGDAPLIPIFGAKPMLKVESATAATTSPEATPDTAEAPLIPALSAKPADSKSGLAATEAAQFNTLTPKQTVSLEAVPVPGGCFVMGCNPEEYSYCTAQEMPAHDVCVGDFLIEPREVTQTSYALVMDGDNPSGFDECGTCPVESVTYEEAAEYCARLDMRLPTEAEWEYAARSAGRKEFFSGTESHEEAENYLWYAQNSEMKTHPAGTKMPNMLGIYDMSGNVAEWTADWFDFEYYGSSPKDNPTGPLMGTERVIRGGSWMEHKLKSRTMNRVGQPPQQRSYTTGFRCAQSVQKQSE